MRWLLVLLLARQAHADCVERKDVATTAAAIDTANAKRRDAALAARHLTAVTGPHAVRSNRVVDGTIKNGELQFNDEGGCGVTGRTTGWQFAVDGKGNVFRIEWAPQFKPRKLVRCGCGPAPAPKPAADELAVAPSIN